MLASLYNVFFFAYRASVARLNVNLDATILEISINKLWAALLSM